MGTNQTLDDNIIKIENKQLVKSETQKKMEAEGWKLFINEDLTCDFEHDGPKFGKFIHQSPPKTAGELKIKYLKMQFKNVKIVEAYDINGNLMNGHRAVYVKG